jgi:hypothetical protein
MYVNKFKISTASLINTKSNFLYFNLPISNDNQIVDNGELIDKVFVNEQVELSINPIVDWEKTRFSPIDANGNKINTIIYNLNFLKNNSYTNFYSDIGFSDDDIANRKDNFKLSLVDLLFYDSDNPLVQKLVNRISLSCKLNSIDFKGDGKPKGANQIQIKMISQDPFKYKNGFTDGFYIYDYKNELKIGDSKYIYMKAVFKNAKTGKSLNMMVKNTPQFIDMLVKELYVRYKIIRTKNGFNYFIDNTYQGNKLNISNNVTYNSDTITVDLYEINAL